MTEPADLLAVQRAHASGGREAAVAEIRRRWPMIAENVIEATLHRVLATPVDPPPHMKPRGLNAKEMARAPCGQFKGKRRS
ncbi:MAG: hypothetical protein WCJ64_24850 [Rhodospirillaceae bacterium]